MQETNTRVDAIDRMSLQGDWSGLLRFAISMGCDRQALKAAFDCVNRLTFTEYGQQYWLGQQIEQFATYISDPWHQIDEPTDNSWTHLETVTLQIMRLVPLAVQTEVGRNIPEEHKARAFAIGLENCMKCISLASSIEDVGLAAFFHNMAGRAHWFSGDLEKATIELETAQAKLDELLNFDSELYIRRSAIVLSNISDVSRLLGSASKAKASARRAIDLLRSAKVECAYDFAIAYGNYANACIALNEAELAKRAYSAAIYYSEEAEPTPGSQAVLLSLRNNFGTVLYELDEIKQSKTALLKAIGKFSNLPQFNTDPAWPSIWFNLGRAQLALGEDEESLASTRKAIVLQEKKADVRPLIHGSGLAKFLVQYASAHTSLGNYLEATKASGIALAIYEKLKEEGVSHDCTDVAWAHDIHGTSFIYQHKVEEALWHYDVALEIYKKLSGRHPGVFDQKIADLWNCIGCARSGASQFAEADTAFQNAISICEKGLSTPEETQLQLAAILGNHADVLRNCGNVDRATEAYRSAVELLSIHAERHGSSYFGRCIELVSAHQHHPL